MGSPYIMLELARERQDMLLAEAEATRRARRARADRRGRGTTATPRSPVHRMPGWLRPAWSRLAAWRPEPEPEPAAPAGARGA